VAHTGCLINSLFDIGTKLVKQASLLALLLILCHCLLHNCIIKGLKIGSMRRYSNLYGFNERDDDA
jgi:hypothetical protein